MQDLLFCVYAAKKEYIVHTCMQHLLMHGWQVPLAAVNEMLEPPTEQHCSID